MSLDCIHCEKSIAVYCGKCVDAEREELNRLRRLAPTGTYTVSLPHEQEIQRLQSQLEDVLADRFNEQLARANEATTKLKFIETEYERANASELTRDALSLQNAALIARCETLRELADSAAAEQGLANRRMMQAQAERDDARAKAADYERDWYAAKSEFDTAMAKMREALRAAEKRELEATAKLVAVAKLLEENGCDCECDHHAEEHDEDCERCLACRIDEAIRDKKEDKR